MRNYSLVPLSVSLLTAFTIAACTTNKIAPEDNRPAIKSLNKLKVPDAKKLPITLSDPIAPDPDKALANYKQILELKPDDVTRIEAMRRMADLQVQVDDASGGSDNSEQMLSASINTYLTLLEETPTDSNNDRILYQLARAYQSSGQAEKSVDALAQLTERYPDSKLSGDAHFRRAELLFRLQRYELAEAEYKTVMALNDDTPFFEPAQYKLGWSLFKQARFTDALPIFFAVLERELPPGELTDTTLALKGVSQSKADLAKDSLRVSSLAFGVMGGGPAVNQYFSTNPEPRFYPLLYTALGELFLDKRRFTDAADAFYAFNQRHPEHPSAPQFQSKVINAYYEGGFNDLVVREKERYVKSYSPNTPYWGVNAPTDEVMTALRGHLEDLAKHYHALAQDEALVDGVASATAKANYLTASDWYGRTLKAYPQDPKAPQINYLYAETLEDGGKRIEAAEQFTRTAYEYPEHSRSQDAAYAAVLAYHAEADSLKGDAQSKVLLQSVEATNRLVQAFPKHPKALVVLTRATQDLYLAGKQADAVLLATKVMAYDPAPTPEQRRVVQGVLGDSYFAQKDYPKAEVAYVDLIKLIPATDPAYPKVVEQLAATVYKQAEAARAAGNLLEAGEGFLRVGKVTPNASIRPTADFDAGAAFIALGDWPRAVQVLEGFRSRYPNNPLLTDVDKKLAVAYVKDSKPDQAAAAFRRIASRDGETPEIRRDAAWQAAKLFDDAKKPLDAAKAYEFYLGAFPEPLDPSIEARRRLADIYKAKPDVYRYLFWLRELITADENAGSKRTPRSKAMAAQAALDVGRLTAQDASKLKLTLPIERSLPTRKDAVEAAIQALEKAASFGFADVATAASYELGGVYQSFGKALMESERPKDLDADALEEYNTLLEEQALPFEDKAIQAHEANLKRLGTGLYDENIAKSVTALGVLSPAKYGKREVTEDRYETLK